MSRVTSVVNPEYQYEENWVGRAREAMESGMEEYPVVRVEVHPLHVDDKARLLKDYDGYDEATQVAVIMTADTDNYDGDITVQMVNDAGYSWSDTPHYEFGDSSDSNFDKIVAEILGGVLVR